MTARHWTEQRERGSRPFILFVVWIAQRLGRGPAIKVLRVTVLYYLLTAGDARAASKSYLQRVLGRPAGWRDVYRHFLTFAITVLDRVYVLSGQAHCLEITIKGNEILHEYQRRNQGLLLMMGHLGSFEIMRGLGATDGRVKLRALMDRTTSADTNAVLDAINPQLRQMFIDTSQSDVDRVLKVQNALACGEVVSLMADRTWPGEDTASCRFLGGKAAFPVSPWLLAGVLRVPVVVGFTLYRGGNHYEVYVEEFAEHVHLPRAERSARAGAWAQAYADRLAVYTRYAPYNWFNFYEFWES